jgi:hypothetical protein
VAKEVKVIYSGGGNRIATKITESIGILHGAQLPDIIYSDKLFFADQNWKDPNREIYMRELEKHRPQMATVLDLEREDQFDEVMSWTEEASKFVEQVIVIPKIRGIIESIPESVNGKPIVLGYSVPTGFGKTGVPFEEFGDREVHLLGGQPHFQVMLLDKLNVISLDNNYIMLKGLTYNCYWTGNFGTTRIWLQLQASGIDLDKNSNYLAFTISWFNFLKAIDYKLNGKELKFESKKSYIKTIQRWSDGK